MTYRLHRQFTQVASCFALLIVASLSAADAQNVPCGTTPGTNIFCNAAASLGIEQSEETSCHSGYGFRVGGDCGTLTADLQCDEISLNINVPGGHADWKFHTQTAPHLDLWTAENGFSCSHAYDECWTTTNAPTVVLLHEKWLCHVQVAPFYPCGIGHHDWCGGAASTSLTRQDFHSNSSYVGRCDIKTNKPNKDQDSSGSEEESSITILPNQPIKLHWVMKARITGDSFSPIYARQADGWVDWSLEQDVANLNASIRCASGVLIGPADPDNDLIRTRLDDCPNTFNPSQHDSDGDGVGDACAPSPTFWVSPNPADRPDYSTIRAALDAVTVSGTVINLMSGTYPEAVTINRDFPLAVQAAPGASVVVDATGKAAPAFTIAASPNAAVTRISGVTVRGDAGGLRTAAPAEVDNCIFQNITGDAAVNASGPWLRITDSSILNGLAGIATGPQTRLDATRVRVDAPSLDGMQLAGSSALVDVVVSNAGREGIALGAATATFDLRYSTIVGNHAIGLTNDPGISQLHIDSSILWANTTADVYNVPCAAVSYSDIGSQTCPALDGNTSLDPQFTPDFHLTPSSPVIDMARFPDADPGVCLSLDGGPRFIDGNADGIIRADMGAYEYQTDVTTMPEVKNLRWPTTPYHTRAEWDAVPGATAYHIYRDLTSALVGGVRAVCRDDLDADRTDTILIDDDEPGTARSYYYLVTADGGAGQSSLGEGTCIARANPAPCP